MNWLDYLGWTQTQIKDLRYASYTYMKQGKYDIAISFFEGLCILDDNNTYDLQSLGALYLETNKPLEALRYLDMALNKNPSDTLSMLNKSKALFSIGNRKEGIKLANALLNTDDLAIKNQASALVLSFS